MRASVVADPVVRQMGTVVGSLCHNDPAGDWPVVALAGRARSRGSRAKRRANRRDRRVSRRLVHDRRRRRRDRDRGALSDAGRRVRPARTHKIERKVGDFATAAAAVRIELAADGTIADATIALGAAGPKAMRVEAAERALRGAKPAKAAIDAAADAARGRRAPAEDNRGSVEFKQAIAGVLVARALTKTFERLGVGGLS